MFGIQFEIRNIAMFSVGQYISKFNNNYLVRQQMVKHIVLKKLKPDIPVIERQREVSDFKNQTEALPDRIP